MPTTYETIEKVSESSFPAFDTWWDGTGLCSSYHRHVISAAQENLCPASTTSAYEPTSLDTFRDNRNLSGRRRVSPPFAYTPYSVSRTETTRTLARRRNGSGNVLVTYHQYGRYDRIGSSCVPTVSSIVVYGPNHVEWCDVVHEYPLEDMYYVNSIVPSRVVSAMSSVENAVSVDALTSYDVLTELAEAREIPSMVRSISSDIFSILRGLKGRFGKDAMRAAYRIPLNQLLKHPTRILRKLGEEWMQYRYGIMPLVYSYRDLCNTVDRGKSVKTRRTLRLFPEPTGISLPASSQRYCWRDTEGEVRCSGNVFQHFDWSSAAMTAGLGVNPIVTLWELIPYSFVVDWFVNVGDYVTRTTVSPATQMLWACLSQHTKTNERLWVHYPNEDKILLGASPRQSVPWTGANMPVPPSVTITRPEESQLLEMKQTNCYTRTMFPIGAAQLVVNPNINWRRLLDSAAMANNLLRNFSSSFR